MSLTPELPEEEEVVKEMYDATYEKVDVVSGPAHGMRFVVLKAGEKQDPAAAATLTTPTHNSAATGSPLEVTPVTKAVKKSPAAPLEVHTANGAIVAPTAVADPADGELRIVTKAEDLDVTEVLANADKGDPTEDAEEPGSPGWEAVDAATARKWTGILSRAKNALGVLSDRENLEVAVGESDDTDSAWDLAEAGAAVDYAIQVLAPFAVDEQSEVDTAEVEVVAKSMRAAETVESDLDTIEGLAPVKKAGRVLSATNEQAIRGAVASLQNVLATLPAPAEAAPVAKSLEEPVEPNETAEPTDETAPSSLPANEEAEPVAKAKGDPLVAVYDAQGRLLGAVDAADLTPLSAGTPVDDAPAEPEPGAEAAAETPPADAATADGTPAAPAAATEEEQPVAKSITDIAELVKSAVADALTATTEEHQKVVKALEDRLAVVEKQPAKRGPLLSGLAQGGLTPIDGGHIALRGQTTEGDDPELVRIHKALEETTDAAEIAQLRRELSVREMTLRLGGGKSS
jgi:hypothetical protein